MDTRNRTVRWNSVRRLAASGAMVAAALAVMTGSGGAQPLSSPAAPDSLQVIAQQIQALEPEPYGWYVAQHVVPAQGLQLEIETSGFLLSQDSRLLVEDESGPVSVLDDGEALALSGNETLDVSPLNGETTTLFEIGLRPFADALVQESMHAGSPLPNLSGIREIELGRDVLAPAGELTIDSQDAVALLMIASGEVEVTGPDGADLGTLGPGSIAEVEGGATLEADASHGATVVAVRIGEDLSGLGGRAAGSEPSGGAIQIDRTDSDGDGLTDADEKIYGSDPQNPDTDEDTLSDGDEVHIYGSSPTSMDSDGDGLPDYNEVMQWFTDPANPDTDGDGLNDHDELGYNTDPLNADSDGDGLSDGDELLVYGTDPLDPDTDDDGVLDGAEIQYGSSPFAKDTDGDGQWDVDEIAFGSDPTDPNSTYVQQN
ncbi:MAG: hypothetical protein IT335_05055 [Thermomicrobiales bacterium]|nr:hypothetical protein [Thermomicrobiales bacterium]